MSYAFKIDKTSYRAVAGPGKKTAEYPEGIADDEVYTEEVPTIVLPPLNEEGAIAVRDSLLATAALRIAPLQDAVDLGEATEKEISALKEWKQYRINLNRISSKDGWPGNVDWPNAPQEVQHG